MTGSVGPAMAFEVLFAMMFFPIPLIVAIITTNRLIQKNPSLKDKKNSFIISTFLFLIGFLFRKFSHAVSSLFFLKETTFLNQTKSKSN